MMKVFGTAPFGPSGRRGLPGFSRSSPAMDSLGRMTGPGKPRYETGWFEQGRTNDLSANSSSFEIGTLGITSTGGATAVRSTAWAADGQYSLLIQNATNNSSAYAGINNAPHVLGVTKTYWATVYNPNASSITVSMSVSGVALVSATIQAGGTTVLVTTWTATITTSGGSIRFTEPTGQPFHVDKLMQADTYGPWTLGGTSRNTLYGSGAITVEESAPNLIQYSDPTALVEFGFASEGVTVASGVAPFLRGGAAFPATNVQHAAYGRSAALTPDSTYTVSVFVRMDDGGAPVPSAGTTSGDFCVLVGGGIITSAASLGVQNLGGGLYRVWGTVVRTSWTNLYSGVIRYATQSGRGFRIGGYMLHPGTYPLSYHPTNGVAATRAAESYQKALTSPLPAEWTALVLFKPTWASTQDVGAASGPVIFCLFGSDFNNRIQLQYVFANDRFRAYKAVAGVAAEPFVPSTAFSADTWIWGAVRQSATTGLRLSLKIGTGAPAHASDAASTAMFSTAPTLTLGTYQGATHHANSAFDHYHIIGRYLTDAQVEAWMYADTPPTAEASTILLEKFRRPSRGLVIG